VDTTGWISIKPTQSTQYWVTVTREYGSLACAADTSIWQEAQSCNTFYIPSAIRLSGTNNLFSPVGVLSEIDSYHMRIYKRWGQLLFETYDFSEAWNGTFNGENVPEDVYVYEVFIKAGLDLPQRRRGIITVLK
jgi:gliding motility-associated-like protein